MSELIDRKALLDSVYKNLPMIPSMSGMTAEEMRLRIAALIENAPAASPWHRVEEPPKEHGKYPVCWIENGNFYWQEAHYCYYQDGDKWVAWSSYQGDDVEITPDYWMPVEPPKED